MCQFPLHLGSYFRLLYGKMFYKCLLIQARLSVVIGLIGDLWTLCTDKEKDNAFLTLEMSMFYLENLFEHNL